MLLVTFVFAGGAQGADPLPAFSAPVVDQAGVVPADVKTQLDASLLDYQNRTGNQIAVAVIKTTGGRTIDDYSLDLARTWAVGQSGKNNGVLLVIAVNDHTLRIEVGTGLTGVLTDAESAAIINQQIVPLLRQGDFGGAVTEGTGAIRAALGDPATAPLKPAPPKASSSPGWFVIFPIFFVAAFGLLGIFFVGAFINRFRGGGRGRGPRNPLLWGGSGFTGGGFTGGGFTGGGLGGGGFSGGGGGSFGGGGASGSW